jgi:hypothetical protein
MREGGEKGGSKGRVDMGTPRRLKAEMFWVNEIIEERILVRICSLTVRRPRRQDKTSACE